jgi:hypothetical protein
MELSKIGISLFLLGLSFCVASGVPVPARTVCYWGRWNADGSFPPNSIPVDKCTHVIYSFIGLNTNTWTAVVDSPNVWDSNISLHPYPDPDSYKTFESFGLDSRESLIF